MGGRKKAGWLRRWKLAVQISARKIILRVYSMMKHMIEISYTHSSLCDNKSESETPCSEVGTLALENTPFVNFDGNPVFKRVLWKFSPGTHANIELFSKKKKHFLDESNQNLVSEFDDALSDKIRSLCQNFDWKRHKGNSLSARAVEQRLRGIWCCYYFCACTPALAEPAQE